jgi:hypothetical protein
MRTTPAETWSRITEYGPSAASVAISTAIHRAGCMMTSLRAARARDSVPSIWNIRAEGRKIRSSKLHAQHHDHVRVLDGFFHRMGHVDEFTVLANHFLHSGGISVSAEHGTHANRISSGDRFERATRLVQYRR